MHIYFNIGKITSQNVLQLNKQFSDVLANPLPNNVYLEPINTAHNLGVINN